MTADEIAIRAMRPSDREAIAALADELVGRGYYPPELVDEYLARSTCGERVLSYVAERERLVAFRFTFPPGRWDSGRGSGLSPHSWPGPLSAAGYFQSCFVDRALTGRGIGRRLAERALDDLRRLGAELVVAHSWKESPHRSSVRYLERLGFVPVAEHPGYWAEVDYLCGGCRLRPCVCTAVEMVLELEASEAGRR